MSSNNLKKVENIIKELCLHFGADNPTQLGRKLGYSSNDVVHKWIERGSIPVENLTKKRPELNPKFLQGQDEPIEIDAQSETTIEKKIQEYKSRKANELVSENERDLLLQFLLDHAESLSEVLRRLVEIERKNRSSDD